MNRITVTKELDQVGVGGEVAPFQALRTERLVRMD
jgi:hypothetical protein